MTTVDAAGRAVPTGRVYKRFEAQFGLDTAVATGVPSWLQAGAGTFSLIGVGAGQGQLRSTTPATLDASAAIQTTPTFDAGKFTEIAITAQGVLCDRDSDMEWSIRLDNVGGFALVQNKTETESSFRIIGSPNTFIKTGYPLRSGGRASARRNITLRWKVRAQEITAEEDGEVYAFAKVPALTLGQIRPALTVTTRLAQASWIECEKFTVETWSF